GRPPRRPYGRRRRRGGHRPAVPGTPLHRPEPQGRRGRRGAAASRRVRRRPGRGLPSRGDRAARLRPRRLPATQPASRLWPEDRRGENLLDSGAPFYDTYETADGEHMSVGALEPKFYAALLRGLGLEGEDLPQHDRERWPGMRARFAEVFRRRTREEWTKIFD